MNELGRLREKAPIIKKLVEKGFFDKKEQEVLQVLGLLPGKGEQEVGNREQAGRCGT